MTNKILIYTDGASRGNPGPGGWGAIVITGTEVNEIGVGEKNTTNNRMELSAAIGALKKTPPGSEITLYTDSAYMINGITKWIHGWMKNEWKTKDKKDVLNRDIWQELHRLVEERSIDWKQVKGHAGIPGNERADVIATAFGDGNDPELFKGSIRKYNIKVSPPTDSELSTTSDGQRKKTKAHSYLSLVDGKLERHSIWKDCEARVKGTQGAKFRKAISKEDEEDILRAWGIK